MEKYINQHQYIVLNKKMHYRVTTYSELTRVYKFIKFINKQFINKNYMVYDNYYITLIANFKKVIFYFKNNEPTNFGKNYCELLYKEF